LTSICCVWVTPKRCHRGGSESLPLPEAGRTLTAVSPDKPASTAPAGDFRLGDWLVQPSLCQLVHGEKVLRLRPKLMDVLVYLACGPGQVISKEKIIDAVWAKEFIAEGTLAQAVFELRAALGDERKGSRFIETIPKRGYRLVAPVWPVTGKPAVVPACVLVIGEREVELKLGETIVGRAPDATVRIDLFEVSRHHARIVLHPGGATIEDLGSRNGTYLRGERLTAPTELHNGDEVRVGPALLIFRELGAGSTQTQRG
jgi:DNA-binding winged helix-turn-helix (wHTH) protein